MGQLGQGISGAGGYHQSVQELFGTNGFHLGDGMQRRGAAELLCLADVAGSGPKAGVGFPARLGEDGDDLGVGIHQLF